MGLNIVAVCHRHRHRMWVFRGHEQAALRHWFFREHAACKDADPRAVEISHDQADDPWLTDESYSESSFPPEGAAEQGTGVPEKNQQARPFGPGWRWYSICSRHRRVAAECRLCAAGSWHFEPFAALGRLAFRVSPRLWRRWVNR